MIRNVLFLCLVPSLVWAQNLYIIAHKDFPKSHLSQKEVRAIFLQQKRRIAGKKILAINHPFSDKTRDCFEKKVLQKSRRNLEIYWLKAHYNGQRPPKVVRSDVMLLEYLQQVKMAIGYRMGSVPEEKNIKVLYQSSCP